MTRFSHQKVLAVNRYDPERAPEPAEWLALDEQVRIELAEEHHRLARVKLPNLKAHAVFHAIVENQLAEDLEPSFAQWHVSLRKA